MDDGSLCRTNKYAVLLSPAGFFHQITGIQFQIATANDPEGVTIAKTFFQHLEDSVLKSESYRGKVLSLEATVHGYSGEAAGNHSSRLHTVSGIR